MPTAIESPLSVIGQPQRRIDGPLKVSGRATYTSDVDLPGLLHAVPVCSTIASGRITSLEFAAAEGCPACARSFIAATSAASSHRRQFDGHGLLDEARPPFEDDVIRYYGQYVAVVVAETFEDASAAAAADEGRLRGRAARRERHARGETEPKVESERGDAARAFDSAPVKIDETYVTPAETHNPIELHATVVQWDGEGYTFYETTQAISNHRARLSRCSACRRKTCA